MFVGVIGPNASNCTGKQYDFGLELGKVIVNLGNYIVCGGKRGLMEAVCRGAHLSASYFQGCTIGILPDDQKNEANQFVDIVIPSGIGLARNLIIINTADILIAVGGGYGTLSEMAFAMQKKKKLLCVTGLGGWSNDLVKIIDNENIIEVKDIKSIDYMLRT